MKASAIGNCPKIYLFFDTPDEEDNLTVEGYRVEMYPQVTSLKKKDGTIA